MPDSIGPAVASRRLRLLRVVGWLVPAALVLALLTALVSWWLPNGTQRAEFVPAKQQCFTQAKGRPYSYCIYTAKQGTSGDIVYHFHGRNRGADGFNDADFYTGQLQAYWQAHGQLPPTVVSVSFGPIWLLMRKTQNPRSGWLDVFERDVVPEVERKLGTPRRRMVLGASMGGFNSLLLALNGTVRFERAVALCPSVYQLTPDATLSELRGLIARTGADPKLIFGLWLLARDHVQSALDWQQLALFDLLERRAPKDSPALYLSCGLYDPYGNYEGTQLFAKRARQRGFSVQFRPLYGGHCAIDIASVAEELVR